MDGQTDEQTNEQIKKVLHYSQCRLDTYTKFHDNILCTFRVTAHFFCGQTDRLPDERTEDGLSPLR